MGGWIRRGWISRSWRAPIFRPGVPKPCKISISGPLNWKSGRLKNAKSNHDGSSLPFLGPLITSRRMEENLNPQASHCKPKDR